MPAPITGQVSVTASAQPLSTSPVGASAWEIAAPLSNSNPVYIGDKNVTVSTGHQLDPGRTFDYQVAAINGQARFELRVSDFYVIGTPNQGDKVTWLVSP